MSRDDPTRWTIIPSDGLYPGMTTYTDGNRVVKCVGDTPKVKTLILEHVKKNV